MSFEQDLFDAAKSGDTNTVKLLLDRGADIHAVDDYALRCAAYGGHENVVKLLLDRGADIHAIDDLALQLAADGGHEGVVKLLLDRGADIHASSDLALQWAARGGHEGVVKLLKQHMSSPTIPNVEPKNNDGRNTCFWCGAPTRIFQMSFGNGNVCTLCGR